MLKTRDDLPLWRETGIFPDPPASSCEIRALSLVPHVRRGCRARVQTRLPLPPAPPLAGRGVDSLAASLHVHTVHTAAHSAFPTRLVFGTQKGRDLYRPQREASAVWVKDAHVQGAECSRRMPQVRVGTLLWPQDTLPEPLVQLELPELDLR